MSDVWSRGPMWSPDLMMCSPGPRHQDVTRPRLPQVSHTLPSKSVVIRSEVTSAIFCLATFPVHCYPFNRENNTNDRLEISGNAHSFSLNFLKKSLLREFFWENQENILRAMNSSNHYIFVLTKYERFLSCPRQFSSVNLPEATVTLY